MAFDTRAYRVLVASPSDVVEERDAAVRVMHDWNNLHSYNRRVVLQPLRWETHSAPEYNVRPQDAINRRIVDDCDLVVGIFWTRLGSPTGEADSGTLEEIERAAKAGKPVMLYFSQVPVAPDKVDTKQIEHLRAFREAIMANALVDSFRSPLEFRDKFAAALELKVRDLQRADEVGQPSPLDLQFVSLDDGKLLGPNLNVSLRVPTDDDRSKNLDERLKVHYAAALLEAQQKAVAVPMVLGIRNTGAVGIRNLFIEISIRPVSEECAVSRYLPTARRPDWSLFSMHYAWNTDESSTEYDEKLAKLIGKELTAENGVWKLRLEWEALQPKRLRVVEPLIFLNFKTSGTVSISARVYAETFAAPLLLEATVTSQIEVFQPDFEILQKRAQALLAAEEQRKKQQLDLSSGVSIRSISTS